MQPPLPTGSTKPVVTPSSFGEKARAVDEAITRLRSSPAALVGLLVEVFRLVGPLGPQAVAYLALKLRLPEDSVRQLAEAYGMADPGVSIPRLGLCVNGSCAARGGAEVERILREKGVPFQPLRCQGACDLGPIACYHHGAPLAISAARARSLAKADPADWEDLLAVEKPVHAFKTEPRVALANVFAKGSHQIATARRHGVYAPLEAALARPPEAVLEAVEQAGLVGAGGRSQPVAERWRAVREAPGQTRYLLIDAAEREPGSFKDRILLERDPHLVIAGALLAAWAVGAREAFLCLRLEYELALERLRAALDEAQRSGFLGDAVAGTGFSLRLELRLVPPPYRAGEASTLIDALEGKPPRRRGPEEPVERAGLFGLPTLVHNVETLARLPAIVSKGGARWRGLGSGSGGLLVCCLSGDLARPGAYEVPRGTPLRELVSSFGGGPAQGKEITAVQVGGAWGAYLPASKLDLPLDDAALAPEGAAVGSGTVMAVSDKACLYDLARRETAFFAREATPGDCEGCARLSDLSRLVDEAPGAPADPSALLEAVRALEAGPACTFARRAAIPVSSLLRHFPGALAEHADGRCACAPKKKAKEPRLD